MRVWPSRSVVSTLGTAALVPESMQLEPAAMVEELRSQHAGARSGQREQQAEAGHKAGRGQDHAPAVRGQLRAGNSAHEREVARDQRPHARRDERDKPRREGHREVCR